VLTLVEVRDWVVKRFPRHATQKFVNELACVRSGAVCMRRRLDCIDAGLRQLFCWAVFTTIGGCDLRHIWHTGETSTGGRGHNCSSGNG
jgi:hypothetical protein